MTVINYLTELFSKIDFSNYVYGNVKFIDDHATLERRGSLTRIKPPTLRRKSM